ncbi:MAG: hypothetical protein Q8S00_18620 [Deltaproteobacteria bacterium]|nr:hypothetical protein [Deltaproteobacteria bacterium]
MKTLKTRHKRKQPEALPIDSISRWFIEAYNSLPREGPRRLEWAVNLFEQKSPLPREDPERGRFVAQIYAFIAYGGNAPTGMEISVRTHPTGKWPDAVLRLWDRMVRAALNHEKIPVMNQQVSLTWWEPKKRFIEWIEHDGHDCLEDAAVLAMRDLLLRHGHLLKECPAPASRGKKGEKCETVFVASRPNKSYCSPQCQTRATTTAARERATLISSLKTPAVRKRFPGNGRAGARSIRKLRVSRGKL